MKMHVIKSCVYNFTSVFIYVNIFCFYRHIFGHFEELNKHAVTCGSACPITNVDISIR